MSIVDIYLNEGEQALRDHLRDECATSDEIEEAIQYCIDETGLDPNDPDCYDSSWDDDYHRGME